MNTPNEIKKAAIKLLHFHPNWFVFGLLPLGFFEQQVQKFRKVQQYQEEDDAFWENPDSQAEEDLFWASLEHHRYVAFQSVLSTREHFSDTELEQYIELCQLDEDETMARSASINLLSWHGLTDEQYDKIIAHNAFSNSVAQKIIWRNMMYSELLSDSISDATFSEMLARQDPVFERELVESNSISRQQLEVMAEKGISRAVRNIAKAKLRRRQ